MDTWETKPCLLQSASILPQTQWFQQAGGATIVPSTTEFHFKAIESHLFSADLCICTCTQSVPWASSSPQFLSTTHKIFGEEGKEKHSWQYNVSSFVTPPDVSIAMDYTSIEHNIHSWSCTFNKISLDMRCMFPCWRTAYHLLSTCRLNSSVSHWGFDWTPTHLSISWRRNPLTGFWPEIWGKSHCSLIWSWLISLLIAVVCLPQLQCHRLILLAVVLTPYLLNYWLFCLLPFHFLYLQ